ncbi:hypothetical protein [Methanosarcina sp.]|uniref:hypothetical protein n=1 Tax=Methanosarcina sp. TaxID=2213 RepID=UPI0029891F78|nr:hypothetical protein [Methanosarcina sp.]MDW5552291.1 hypothetical protein [Methanosarcina sp.]
MKHNEFMSYIKSEKKEKFSDFMEEFKQAGLYISGQAITKYIEDYEKENKNKVTIVRGMLYLAGYCSAAFPVLIYIKYVYPLFVKVKKYFYIAIVSIILLVISLIYILATISYNSIKILLFLIIPSLLGISYTILQGIKIWSEAKKNFIEAKKLEKELEKF